jgi:hypothetical protein
MYSVKIWTAFVFIGTVLSLWGIYDCQELNNSLTRNSGHCRRLEVIFVSSVEMNEKCIQNFGRKA